MPIEQPPPPAPRDHRCTFCFDTFDRFRYRLSMESCLVCLFVIRNLRFSESPSSSDASNLWPKVQNPLSTLLKVKGVLSLSLGSLEQNQIFRP